jgi:hypothetical protein
MPLSAEELNTRRPVWSALSSMFLDIDVAIARDWRAGVLAASPYSTGELEEILITEIYPVCWANLNSGHGERSGFDPAWLESMILQREASGEIFTRLLELARISIPRSSEWQATKTTVASMRHAENEG